MSRGFPRRGVMGVSFAIMIAVAAMGPAAAAPSRSAPRELKAIEQMRASQEQARADAQAAARAAALETKQLADERVAAAQRLQQAEDAVAATSARVADLADKAREAEARLARRSAELGPMLPLIERLSLYPSETMLAVPLSPEDALRGVLVMNGITRELETEARALQAERADVAARRAALDAELPSLRAAQAEQAREAGALDAKLGAARDRGRIAEDAAAEASRKAAAAAAEAVSVRAALARIETERLQAASRAREDLARANRQRRPAEADDARARQEALAKPAGPGVGDPHGQLTAPVAGSVMRAFGAAGDGGPSTGITYQAPPSARVVASCGGRIVFAGPFRSYGQLVIIDCGSGTHLVLAGLDRIDVRVGQSVQVAEPVGVMPGWDPRAGGAKPGLYVEVRRGGEPVDPAPFLRARG